MNKGWITRIQRFSLHDGPGIRTTFFLKGCPLSCAWCHNPENISEHNEVMYERICCADCGKCLEICERSCFVENRKDYFDSTNCDRCGRCIENCQTGALTWSGRQISAAQIITEAAKDKLFYTFSGGGLTLSGGEPLHQIGFCREIAARAKDIGLHVAVDTSGFVRYEAFEAIGQLVDLYLYDLKFIDAALHKKFTGQDNQLILANFKRLCSAGRSVIVRIPLVAGITDMPENLGQITDFVAQWGNGAMMEKIPFNPLMKEKYRMLGRKQGILI